MFSFQGADLVRTDSVSFVSALRRNLIHFIVLPLPRKPARAGLCSDLGDVFLIQDQIETLHICKMLQSKLGGDNRNRTDDPLLARQVLSQLSYTPIIKRWWAQVDSNHRPHDYQSCALAS